MPTSRLRSIPRAWAIASLRTTFKADDWGIGSDRSGPGSESGSSDSIPATISRISGPMRGPESARLDTKLRHQLRGSAFGLERQRREQVQWFHGLSHRDAAPPIRRVPRLAPQPAVNDSNIRTMTP